METRYCLASAAACAILLFLHSAASAQQVFDWNDPAGGLYTVTTNWTPTGVPNTASESARFNVNATYDVLFLDVLSSVPVSDLLVDDGDVTFALNSGASGDLSYTTDDDARIDGGILRLTPVATTDHVNLTVGDQLAVFGGGMLVVSGGSTTQVDDDLRVGAQSAGGGDGEVLVTGAGSTLNVLGSTFNSIGGFGHSGTLTFEDNAAGLFNDDLSIAFSSFAGTAGIVEVVSGADLQVDSNIDVGMGSNTGQSALLLVSGLGSTLTQSGAGETVLGGAVAGNTAEIRVADRGVYTSGTGAIAIDDTGLLHISGGVFNAGGAVSTTTSGSIVVDGGTLNINAGFDNSQGGLDLADGVVNINTGAITMPTPGGLAVSGDDLADAPHFILSNAQTTSANGAALVGTDSRGQLTINDGSELTATLAFIGTQENGDGVVRVAGAGSAFSVSGSVSIGASEGAGALTIVEGAEASGDDLIIGDGVNSDGTVEVTGAGSRWTGTGQVQVGDGGEGALTISAGAHFSSAAAEIGEATQGGIATVDGAGTTWTNSAELLVKGGTLTIRNAATVSNTFARFGSAIAGPFGIPISSSGTVNVDGVGSRWTSSSLVLGSGGAGFLNVTNGGEVISSSGTLGQVIFPGGGPSVQGAGTAIIDGSGSTWTIGGDLEIGETGDGVLVVTGGGSVSNAAASIAAFPNTDGSATIDGDGSTWTNTGSLAIGKAGDGVLNITSGGAVTSAGGLVADFVGSTGDVVVEDDGSSWTNSGLLELGIAGQATMQIQAGGVVSNTSAHVATSAAASGDVTVTGAGSSWANSGDLFVGGDDVAARGAATITIEDQGLVTVGGAMHVWDQGHLVLAGGTLEVDSTAVTIDGQLDYVTGAFRLTDAGGFTIGANSGPIDQALGGVNAILPAGGGLLVAETLTIPAGASLNAIHGSTITADRMLVNDGLVIANNTPIETGLGLINNSDLVLVDTTVDGPVANSSGAAITVLGDVDFNGLVSGAGDFFGPGAATFNGGIAPGASPALVTFEGDIVLGSANALEIEIGGTTPGVEYDRIEVDGVAQLDGILQVELIDLGSGVYEPQLGDSFAFLASGGGGRGMWRIVDLPELAPGLEWLLNPGGLTISLNVVAALPGDYNFDGVVDAADYTVYRDTLGQNGIGLAADGDADGDVDTDDYAVWAANYGTTLPPPSLSVPEPTTSGLAFATLVCGLGRRRRCAEVGSSLTEMNFTSVRYDGSVADTSSVVLCRF